MGYEVVLLIIMIVASAFFSGLEIALFSLGKAHVRSLVERGVPGANTIRKLKRNPERLLVIILIGNNVANIGSASLATAVAIRWFGNVGVGLATGVMTLLILIFGEIIPKTFSVRWAEKIALFSARILVIFGWIVLPAAYILEKLSKGITHLLKGASAPQVDHDVIVTTLSRLGLEEGKIEEHEHRLVESAFRLDQISAERLMTPRSDMIYIEAGTPIGQAADYLKDHPYSRYPVYKDDKEGVIGVLHIRDLYENLRQNREKTPVEKISAGPLFVACTMAASDLLVLFQRERAHMAIVLDEYGDTDGIVTLEDVIEELVGEIEDEADAVRHDIIKIQSNRYLVYASLTIDDINRALDISLPDDIHHTLNGLLLDKFQNIPQPQAATSIGGYTFIVRQADARRIILVELQIPKSEIESSTADART